MIAAAPPRIALFGGTFDPVHLGHLALARQACNQLQLDRVIFIPSGTPPHRADGPVASAQHRCAMVAVAIAEEPSFELSDVEARRTGPSFTVDTVFEFSQAHPDAQLFFLLGDDCAAKLHRWKGIDDMLKRVTFVTAHRFGAPPDATVAQRLVRVDMPAMPQASTHLRQRLANGHDICSHTRPSVADYIARERLYQGTSPTDGVTT